MPVHYGFFRTTEKTPLIATAASTAICIAISIFSLLSGWMTIFQNLFYIPIILACVFYTRRGFVFSIILSLAYFVLMASFTRDPSTLLGAVIRVIIFIVIAGIITYLSEIRITAQQTLREREEQYRTLVEQASEAIIIVQNGTLAFANQRMADLAGTPARDLVGRPYLDNVHPDDRHQLNDLRTSGNRQDQSPRSREFRIRNAEGRTIWVSMTTARILWKGLPAALNLLTDITGRRQAEDTLFRKHEELAAAYQQIAATESELRLNLAALEESRRCLSESEEKFRSLAESSQDYIMRYDRECRHLYMNPAGLRVAGLNENDIIGKTHREAGFDPGLSEMWEEKIRHVFVSGESAQMTFGWESADGPVHLDWMLTPEYNPDGSIRSVLGVSRDITRQKMIEDALRSSEEFNRGIVENMPDIVAVYGFDRNIRFINPAVSRILGYPPEEVTGTDILAHVVPDLRVAAETAVTGRIRSGIACLSEIEVLARDGRRVTLLSKGAMTRYHNEPAVLLVLTDISERKQLERVQKERKEEAERYSAALAMANRKLNLLGSVTRHDITNKLTALSAYLLEQKIIAREPDVLGLIEDEESIIRMIRDYLAFSKMYEKIGVTAPVWMDVEATIRRAVAATTNHGVAVEADFAGLWIWADPLLEKVFMNLMDNAVRHGEHVRRVRVHAEELNGVLKLVWEDDGVGIPAEEKEYIFSRGYGKNTGLGLFLVREILSITDISIREIGEPGRGARFEFTLPEGTFCRSDPALRGPAGAPGAPSPACSGSPGDS